MPKNWKIDKGDVQGGETGRLLDGVEVRENVEEGCFELVAVLAKSEGNILPAKFPAFAYRGLVWHLDIETLNHGDLGDQPFGPWHNNHHPRLLGEEDGTWTAQAGSGGMGEDDKEDAASASA